MFVDEVEVTVKAGDGGNGRVAFFAGRNGPSGGDGGRGGDVYALVNSNLTDLKKYLSKAVFKGVPGEPGGANRRLGLNGEETYLPVPIGTTIIDLKTNKEVEITTGNPKLLLATGGIGGHGNDYFKTSTHRTPRRAELGKPGETKRFRFILKLIAECGFIGLPNAGKSSLLNILTAAAVKTANYPFTTLSPNLGVHNGHVLADIPGLIEGASSGRGLGIKFLKHIEKVRILFHCVSVENQDIKKTYLTVIDELKKYGKGLTDKKMVILLTKTDLVSDKLVKEKIEKLKTFHNQIIPISIFKENSLIPLKKIIDNDH